MSTTFIGKIPKEEGDEQHDEITEYRNLSTQTNQVLDIEAMIYRRDDGLAAGHYSIQFEFTLPSDLPSTLDFAHEDIELGPTLKTAYSITATLKHLPDRSIKLLEYTVPIVIN